MKNVPPPTNRFEVVLRALGFDNPSDEERNPNECWINLWFPGIEAERISESVYEIRGHSSELVQRVTEPVALASYISDYLAYLMSILSDEECGIR